MAGKCLELDDNNFAEIVLKSEKPVLVDFWATWCSPCNMLAPTIEELAEQYDGKAIIAKLDVVSAQKTAEQYSVMSIPTLILFKNGRIEEKVVGAVPKSRLSSIIEKHI